MKGKYEMDGHATRQGGHRLVGRFLAILSIVGAVCGGFLTGGAMADEPQKCNTAMDRICYAGYNAAGLKRIADYLSLNGKKGRYYDEMEANLTNGVEGAVTLTDGTKLPFKLIGVLHDNKADGSGRRAGLTFMAFKALPRAYCMNGTMPDDDETYVCSGSDTNRGGWRDSRLRQWMNKGEIWNMFPEDFRNNVATVLKQTNNMEYGDTANSVTSATADRLWLVSYRELVPTMYTGWQDVEGFQALSQEGKQYEFFRTEKGMVSNVRGDNESLADMGLSASSGSSPAGGVSLFYERSPFLSTSDGFAAVNWGGNPISHIQSGERLAIVPAFSF